LIGRSWRPIAETTSLVGYLRLHGPNYKNWFTALELVAFLSGRPVIVPENPNWRLL